MSETAQFDPPRRAAGWRRGPAPPRWGLRHHHRWWDDGAVRAPACDVLRDDDHLVVRMEIPGIDVDRDVRVSVDDTMLCIRGERRAPDPVDDRGRYHRETWAGAFERGIRLPSGVEPAKVTAHYADGVLEVRVPVPANEVRRTVPIVTIAPTLPSDDNEPLAQTAVRQRRTRSS